MLLQQLQLSSKLLSDFVTLMFAGMLCISTSHVELGYIAGIIFCVLI